MSDCFLGSTLKKKTLKMCRRKSSIFHVRFGLGNLAGGELFLVEALQFPESWILYVSGKHIIQSLNQ